MSNLVNDQIKDNISDDVYDLYNDKGVHGVIDANFKRLPNSLTK